MDFYGNRIGEDGQRQFLQFFGDGQDPACSSELDPTKARTISKRVTGSCGTTS